jgi:hypothetical protein
MRRKSKKKKEQVFRIKYSGKILENREAKLESKYLYLNICI